MGTGRERDGQRDVSAMDYLDRVQQQLTELTEHGAHRRLRARAGLRTVGEVNIPRGAAGGRGPRRRRDLLAIASALVVTVAVVAVVLSIGGGASHPTAASHRAPAVRRHPAPRASVRKRAQGHGVTSGSVPAGPVPSGFGPESFTAIGEQTWWLLGSAPCASPPCTSIVRTDDGGRSFVGIPAPRTAQVSQLRFADPRDGFAYDPSLWVTHDAGGSWYPIDLGGSVTNLSISDGEVFAIVQSGGRGRLMRAPVGSDRWATLAAAGDAYGGLWAHGSDVLLEASDTAGAQLLVSHDAGASFTRSPVPPSVACDFQEQAGPVVWAHCSTGMLSTVFRSADYGRTLAPARGGLPELPNSAAFAAASSSTAVVGYQQLYRTTDGGVSYTPVATPMGITWWQYLGFTDSTHGVALGYVGSESPRNERLYYTTDGGLSYHPVTIG